MLQATEHQLSLVARKVHRLESTVQTQMESLKSLRQQRSDITNDVETLRAQLAAAEAKAEQVYRAHDEAQAALKASAEEYAAAQLLQKKYQNTVHMLQGHCRAFVRLLGADRGGQSFVIADECTVNAVDRKKSFLVDSVFDESSADDLDLLSSAINVSSLVSDVLAGMNIAMIAFGPSRSGKSSFLFGSHNLPFTAKGALAGGDGSSSLGVLDVFVSTLFRELEANEVTHFNIRCSFSELSQEQLTDLLSEYGGVSGGLGYRGGVVGGLGQQNLNDQCSVQVQSAEEALRLVHSGMSRMASNAQLRSHSGGAAGGGFAGGTPSSSHLFFTVLIENFNTKGHFRRATATFVDLAGAAHATSIASTSPEQVWVNKSITAFCDMVSMLSAANQQQIQVSGQPLTAPLEDLPHRHHRLIQLLKPILGGNSKTILLCCANCRVNSTEEVLSALTYAYYFKMVKNFPVPYDIPPELQRLNLQMNRFHDDE